MPTAAWVLLVFVVLFLVWFIGNYNLLVGLRNHCHEAWSGIDTELKRRYELIPNLVRTVQGYAKHESATLDAVVEARNRAAANSGAVASQVSDENQLIGTLRSLFAVVENYPDLKASDNFLALQQELINTEDRIQAARRFYNANVRDLNTRIEMFPSNLIAGMFGFERETFFEVQSAIEREAPQVDAAQG